MLLPKTVEHQYSPIMADIYGSQIYVLPRSGLADVEDEDDIIVKLDSLKASGKKQPLVLVTNDFEKLGHSNSRTPLLCLQDRVLVLKDASISADWNWSTSFRRWGFENARSQTKLLMWVQNFKRGQKNSEESRKPEPFVVWAKTTIFTLITWSGTVGVLRGSVSISTTFVNLCPNRTTRKGNRAQLVLRPHRNLIRQGQNSSEPEIFADRIPDVNPPAEKISCTSPMLVKS